MMISYNLVLTIQVMMFFRTDIQTPAMSDILRERRDTSFTAQTPRRVYSRFIEKIPHVPKNKRKKNIVRRDTSKKKRRYNWRDGGKRAGEAAIIKCLQTPAPTRKVMAECRDSVINISEDEDEEMIDEAAAVGDEFRSAKRRKVVGEVDDDAEL